MVFGVKGGDMKGFTLFSGFEGVGVGMKAAGVEHVGGIEYDDKIANVARVNGFHATTANVLTAVPDDYPDMDLLHASPPCPNFSQAKAGGKETAEDIAVAQATAKWIIDKLPSFFTLENVYQYRESESWRVIARTLLEHGYLFNYWHVNMADYGIPQTRKRMIVIARRDGRLPMLPAATHAKNPQAGLFGTLKKWVGWYEAIEDLIPSLPDSQFAEWQLSRLPAEFSQSWLCEVAQATGGSDRWGDEPTPTILSQGGGRVYRAYLVDSAGYLDNQGNGSVVHRHEDDPANTVVSNYERRPMRAVIVPGGNAASFGTHEGDEPVRTVESIHRVGNMPRAFIVNGANTGQEWGNGRREGDEPVQTITSSLAAKEALPKAFVVNDADSKNPVKNGDQPMATVVSFETGGTFSRATVNGRIVQMTPRALARFQSFPDWFWLPSKKSLACKGIGNAVPPLFAEQLAKSLL